MFGDFIHKDRPLIAVKSKFISAKSLKHVFHGAQASAFIDQKWNVGFLAKKRG